MLYQRTSFEVPKPCLSFDRYDTLLASAVIELDFDLFTLKLVRIIVRGIRKPILMFLGLFVLDLWANTMPTPVRCTHHMISGS